MNFGSTTSANKQIARAAGTVMLALVLSSLTGLLRQILVANTFGTQADIDAFNAANRVSETLFTLIAGGALASAFIPVFTDLITRDKRQYAWKLASSIANIFLVVLIFTSLAALVFAPWIVRNLLAPGFSDNPAQEELAVSLLRLMLPSAVFFGLSGLLMGILNSHQIFFIPALAPSMYQLGMIFGILVLTPYMGIYGLAWGVVLGAGLHMGLQIPYLFRLNARYYSTFGLDNQDVHEVVRLLIPRLFGVAVVQLNFWVNTYIASRLEEGSLTGIVFAFALMLMPQAAIAQSIAIAAMPTFSAQVALGKLGEMRSSLASTLRGVIYLSIPAALGLILLRRPIITILYQRGAFDERSTDLVAWALLWFALGLVSHSLVEILARAFYALHDTRTPVIVGVGAMSLNVLLSFILTALFARAGWMPHGGLALANTIATTLEMGGLIILMRRRLGGLDGTYIRKGFITALIGGGVMALLLVIWISKSSVEPVWLVVLGGILIGALAYGILLLVMGVSEVRTIIRELSVRLRIT
ncbi:MAG: murein biosynthesis integral membrane protein MurJ [Anaerolineales bacterium]